MMKTPKSCLCLATFVTTVSSNAQVMLQDSYRPPEPLGVPTLLDGGAGPFGYEIDLDPETEFSAADHGKVVMVLSGKDEDGGDLDCDGRSNHH